MKASRSFGFFSVSSKQCNFTTGAWLKGKSKPAIGNEGFPTFAPLFAVGTTPEQLILGDQVVQLRNFIWNMTSNSFLNPCQDFVRFIYIIDRCIAYPQQHMIVWFSTVLVFFLPVKVVYSGQNLSIDYNLSASRTMHCSSLFLTDHYQFVPGTD